MRELRYPSRSGRRWARSRAGWLPALFLAAAGAGAAPSTQEVFEANAPRVLQVRIVEAESGSKRSIGSGFVASEDGHVVTNYHVVSEIVHHPERYRIELVTSDETTQNARLLAFDVVHDLAVVEVDLAPAPPFSLLEKPHDQIRKGDRLYSLGNPLDIGMSIVEGTYNGLLEHSRYERIHFTGSLNAGMSGGPAILGDGRVVGVNVASAGNQVSFLVPAEQVSHLLARVRTPGFEPPSDAREELRTQLLAHQREYLGELLARPIETVRLGSYEAPTQPAPFFNCWGDTVHDEGDFYEAITHVCFTQDSIFVSDEQSFSLVRIRHRQLESEELGASRFYSLYTSFFERNYSQRWGSEEDFTPFRCTTRFVQNQELVFKTAFCARRYRDLPGLFDVIFKAAALGRPNEGFETALVLSAIGFDGAVRLSEAFLGAIRRVE